MTTGSLQCLFPNTYFLLKKIGGKALFNLHELKHENSTSCETSLWILKDLKSWQKKKRILAEIWNFILSFLFFFSNIGTKSFCSMTLHFLLDNFFPDSHGSEFCSPVNKWRKLPKFPDPLLYYSYSNVLLQTCKTQRFYYQNLINHCLEVNCCSRKDSVFKAIFRFLLCIRDCM